MMFWLTKHGLDGDALLSWSPTARPLTRMPLNRVRWMDCDLDQAGGPNATPRRPPADSNSHMHVNAQTHTHKYRHAHGPMHIHIILKGECVQLQGETWQRRDQLSSRQMTRDVGSPIIFPAPVLKPCCCLLLTTGLLLSSPLFMVLSTLKEHLQPHCLNVRVRMSAAMCSSEMIVIERLTQNDAIPLFKTASLNFQQKQKIHVYKKKMD